MTWQERFDRLLKAMSEGEPHKAEKRAEKAAEKQKDETKVRAPRS
jgi:hypothetical protein